MLELVEFWSDLVEGQGAKEEWFRQAYCQIVAARAIKGVSSNPETIRASLSVLSRIKEFEVFYWHTARAAVKIERLGNDLYLSWRVYVLPGISWVRVLVWLGLCLAGANYVTPSAGFYYQYGAFQGSAREGTLIGYFIVIVLMSALAIVLVGTIRDGDGMGLWRGKLDEFHRDEAAAAGHIAHYSVLHAADAVGIDSARLTPRQLRSVEQRRRI